MENRNLFSIIRVVAAIYLIYLGYNLVQAYISGEGPVWILIPAIGFFAASGVIIFFAVRAYMRNQKELRDERLREMAEREKEQPPEPQEEKRPRTMTEIASYRSGDDEEEEE